MARSRVGDGDGLQLWRVVAYNRQGVVHQLEGGCGANNSSQKKIMLQRASDLDGIWENRHEIWYMERKAFMLGRFTYDSCETSKWI
jgi:hypothetical protein